MLLFEQEHAEYIKSNNNTLIVKLMCNFSFLRTLPLFGAVVV